MGKEISIRGVRYWGLDANLNGVSFNEDKLFGFDITDANKIIRNRIRPKETPWN